MLTRIAAIVVPSQHQIVDYINYTTMVSAYAYAMTIAKMEPIPNPPSWYADYHQKFTTAVGHAMDWHGSITPNFLSIPNSIVSFNDLFLTEMNGAQVALDILSQNPGDEKAKQSLQNFLSALSEHVNKEVKTLESLEINIAKFSSDIQEDAKILQGIVNQAIAEIKANRDNINAMNKEISALNETIEAQQTWLTAAYMGTGVSIFVGIVGIALAFVCLPAGIAVIGVGVAGLGGSITGWVALQQHIKDEQDLIIKDQGKISQDEQQITYMQALTTQFERLVKKNEAAQQALSSVKQMWSDLDQELRNVLNKLEGVEQEVSSQDYQDAKDALPFVASAWQDADTFAKALQGINYTFDPNVVKIPQTQAA